VSVLTDLTGSRVLSRDSRVDRGIGPREAAVDAERLRYGRWNFGKSETHSSRFRVPRRMGNFSVRHQRTLCVNRDTTYCVPGARARRDEMEWLAGQ
jgi:hypothetical protein